MSGTERQLTRVLGGLRREISSAPPEPGTWDRVEERASGRRRSHRVLVIASAATAAVLVAALVAVLPNRGDTPAKRLLGAASGKLLYISYEAHEYDAGTHIQSRIFSKDLATGEELELASGQESCVGVSPQADPERSRLLYCMDDRYWVLDVASGAKTQLGDIDQHITHSSWTPEGTALFQKWGKDGALLVFEDGRFRTVYSTPGSLWQSVVPMRGGVIAAQQCFTDVCGVDQENMILVQLAREGSRNVFQRPFSYPMVAFDDGRALLYQFREGTESPDAEAVGRTAPALARFRLAVLRVENGRWVSRPTDILATFGTAAHGGAAVGPDGRIALAGVLDGDTETGIYVLDPQRLQIVRVVAGDGPIAWTPDGKLVYTDWDTNQTEIRITDLEGRSRFLLHGPDVRPIAVVPN